MGDYKRSTPQGPPLPKIKSTGARLLSLDGGGVLGVSSLIILQEIMNRVREIEISKGSRNHAPRLPVDYFELAAGTSTGGLIALMLFRLRMSVEQCLEAYDDLAKNVFAPTILWQPITTPGLLQKIGKSWLWTRMLTKNSMYDNRSLIKAIDTCVRKHGLDYIEKNLDHPGQTKLVHEKAGMMFMCTTDSAKAESVLLRSYVQSDDSHPITGPLREAAEAGHMNSIDICTAALATSAAPFFLPEVPWNPSHQQHPEITFWDGGMLNNNPVMQLWNARYDLVGLHDPAPKVNCVLSLGCSHNTIVESWWNKNPIIRAVTCGTYITNTIAKDADFARDVQRMQDREDGNKDLKYFRFDADTGKRFFEIDDASGMSDLKKITSAWLISSKEIQDELDDCAQRLAQ